MGCFSFMCKESDRAVLSTSFSGDAVHLFLLKDGKVIEKMYGNYDSYGRVFNGEGESFKWNMPWHDVCNLMFDYDESNGIAAILAEHWKEGDAYPTKRSDNDPNQGWGEDYELLASDTSDYGVKVENPTHESLLSILRDRKINKLI